MTNDGDHVHILTTYLQEIVHDHKGEYRCLSLTNMFLLALSHQRRHHRRRVLCHHHYHRHVDATTMTSKQAPNRNRINHATLGG